MVLTAHTRPVDNTMHVGMQTSLFGTAELNCRSITADWVDLDDRSSTLFEPGWVEGSDTLFEQLRVEMPWRSMERAMYDRIVDVPRLICNVSTRELAPVHPLAMITTALQSAFQVQFSSVGLNFYRTGNDSVAWHRDSIGRTGTPSTVVLVSLGSPRTLAMRPYRPKASKPAETTRSTAATRIRWRLGHGDLLVMRGACQREWEHGVPKERAVGPRISLAFRSQEAAKGPRKAGAGVTPLLASHKLR